MNRRVPFKVSLLSRSKRRLVMEDEKFVAVQLSESQRSAFRIAEFYFENARRQRLYNGSYLPLNQVFGWLIR